MQGTKAWNPMGDDLTGLLPASTRTKEDDLVSPVYSPIHHSPGVEVDRVRLAAIHDCVDEEIDLRRLADIHSLLWIAGRPMPPRPLHQQCLLNREIVVAEKMDLHLVWTTDRIFIKPLSRFLLAPHFWKTFLCCHSLPASHIDLCSCGSRPERAVGFLFSYPALIKHEGDFHLAKETHLIPEEMQWSAWRTAVHELLSSSPIYPRIHPRFHYGELRLSRLDKIYFF